MNRDQVLAALRRHRQEIEQRFAIKHLSVFGSAARDELRDDSDIDVLVEFKGVLPTSLRESRFSIAYSHPYERNPMTWRRYENQHPVARRTPTRPVGGSVCALASDAHAPARPHSASVMGASRGLSPRHASLPCGSACAVVVECPQKTDGHAPSRADDGGALPAPGLCGSAERLSKVKALSQHPGRVTPGRWHPAVHPRSRLDAAA